MREIWHENVEASQLVGDCSDILPLGHAGAERAQRINDKPQHLVVSGLVLVFLMVATSGIAPSDRTVVQGCDMGGM